VNTNDKETHIIINDSFRLSPLETRKEGLGSFHGGENISILVNDTANAAFNFSVVTYNGIIYSNTSSVGIHYSFIADADYYEVAFFTNSNVASEINFEVLVQKPKVIFPFSWLTLPAEVMFFFSLAFLMLALLRQVFNQPSMLGTSECLPVISQKSSRILLVLVLLSLAVWVFLLAVNTHLLGTFESWYTDNARNPYSASLFTKVGFAIFNTPLGRLASNDSSPFKFVTWPEMPHLYPLGSVFLFLPFGFLLQNGVNQVVVFKAEIAVFLVFAHVGVYYFLKRFWKLPMNLPLKLIGVYAVYAALIVYSADGMFDAVAFTCSLLALTLFFAGRFDYFLLFAAVSAFLKYQAGIFLFPLILVGLVKVFGKYGFSALRNKAVIFAGALAGVDAFTAFSSMFSVISIRPEFVMNAVNAFRPHSQVSWALQVFVVLLTLAGTVLFAVYMLRRNSLLSMSAVFVLLPVFVMPYFQPWYLPFFLVYVLIPRKRQEVEATMLWLVFIMAILYFGWVAFNPLQILSNLGKLLRL
jgi:hypothetical protein